ncbi:hypothetical protein BHE90_006434 [Fusarium euwallaceae]|uniref:Uncharacterized protein n=2 Tax=Fusarium solani species complex TaxID=232080 RepID=A0A3M2SF42_9HYPO|nr:hypothetical protein CDV36_004101 [Fusarium kuroshium]RTE79112.1 hypothetical protein BHE90_006434 [Fusarium euwallaceae]
MSIPIIWSCTEPTGGLRTSMERLARQMVRDGGYDYVDILSTPKSMSGGRKTACHFKVRLIGRDEGRQLVHDHRIKLEHRDPAGTSRRYQLTGKDARYDYSSMQAKNGPPSSCPKNKRLQRQAEAAGAAADGGQTAQHIPGRANIATQASKANQEYHSATTHAATTAAQPSGGNGSGAYGQAGQAQSTPSKAAQGTSSAQQAAASSGWINGWYLDPYTSQGQRRADGWHPDPWGQKQFRWFQGGYWSLSTR